MKSKSSKKSGFWNKLKRIVLKSIMWFFIVSISWVILARFIPVFYTPLMFIRSAESIFDGKTPKIRRDWTSIKNISPNMVQAVVASEDNLFMEHNGFSIDGIEKALKHNKKGRRIHGGSTISQQTAKNVFLWPQRSWVRKGLEAYFTVLIEVFWSKERIMEVYLNVIETGDGIYGVEKAANIYFDTSAKKLSRPQAVAIAVCLPNPRKFNAGNPSPYIQRRKAKILNLMSKIHKVKFD
jgi:monofunctional glycosyltransferase